ncbi:MAG: gamma-glutamyltransferase [Xanthobacteraceae bacterium]|nr:gamma-glutamyltransferase [Xanthobacteraceae bacterium]
MRNFQLAGRSTVHALNGMAATSHPQATLAAIEVLKAGGTAADAAVAACALLGVIEPQSTGIGGDCFALYMRQGRGDVISYNGSGRAPEAAEAAWYLERRITAIPLTSVHAVTVPGAVDAWARILRDHGRLSLDRLLQPAIEAAEHGYVVAPRVAFDWRNNVEKLRKGANAPRYLLRDNAPPAAGDVIRQPELARTLRIIASEGPDGFYKGAVAEDMVDTLRGLGGLHTLDDFAAHTTETSTPIGTAYKGYEVWQCPPNGPGLTMLVMLNVLSHFDLTPLAPLGVERLHLEAEAARAAYMMRETHIADPAHVDVDVARILAKEFAAGFAAKIRMDGMLDIPDVWPRPNPSTIYVTVVDKDRNACSFINSIAHPFGSGIVSNKTGVLMQNRGVGFRVEPGHPNCIAPRKRPLHTIIPCMVTKGGRAAMPFGVMGGQYQPVGQCHVLTNMLDFGMDVQEAIDLPRAFHYDGLYQLEDGIPESTAEALRAIGHRVSRAKLPWGGGQAIWIDWDKGTLTGGSDPRKDGCALGY